MNLEKIKEERLKKLEKAYVQLMKVLDKDLNTDEVDPEKMKISLSAYKQAAEDSDFILKQIIDLSDMEFGKKETKTKSINLSPEQRIK